MKIIFVRTVIFLDINAFQRFENILPFSTDSILTIAVCINHDKF